MTNVDTLAKERDPEQFMEQNKGDEYIEAYKYFRNSIGASTDKSQRELRHEALSNALI